MVNRNIRCIHASGKYDITPAAFARYLNRLANAYDADVITTTECQNRAIMRAVRKAMPGFRVAKRGEFLVIWRKATIRQRHPARLIRLTWTRDSWRDSRLMLKGLKTTGGHKFRVMVSHLPSGVQHADDWKPGKASITSRAAFRKWGRIIARASKKVTQVAVFDSNLDQNRRVWQEYATDQLHAPSIWAQHRARPLYVSHGDRLIDTAHVRGARVLSAFVLTDARPKGLDHRPIAFTIDGKKARR